MPRLRVRAPLSPPIRFCPCSSVGQSGGVLSRASGVRVPPGVLFLCHGPTNLALSRGHPARHSGLRRVGLATVAGPPPAFMSIMTTSSRLTRTTALSGGRSSPAPPTSACTGGGAADYRRYAIPLPAADGCSVARIQPAMVFPPGKGVAPDVVPFSSGVIHAGRRSVRTACHPAPAYSRAYPGRRVRRRRMAGAPVWRGGSGLGQHATSSPLPWS